MDTLTDLGFKLQRTAKGNLEAVPAEILCLCAGCDGTGARELEDDPGSYVMCLSCDGKGLY
jgi:DnaJ-class molecular chaperone